MKDQLNIKNNSTIKEEWDQLIARHKLRFEIWALLELHNELNVTQITRYVDQSKTTVARHLRLMEKDGLIISRIAKEVVKGRIPPKIYQINPKFKKEEEEEENFYKRVITHYRKAGYNITKLLSYLSPLLNLLESELDDPESAKDIYDEYLSFIPAPVVFYLDKKRAEALMDIHAEYVLKLQKLVMEEDLNTEEAFVYFDISLPLAALFELKKKLKLKK
ncbi:MAG: winged helix-turn-helix domain-containing protein [Candidatus Hermodarchaeota archaeon]